MEKQRLIDSFHKNSMEVVKVHVQEWKGQEYVDVRVWYSERAGQNGAENVTRKGICISTELLPDLIRALEKAQLSIDGPEVYAGRLRHRLAEITHGEDPGRANAKRSIQDPCLDEEIQGEI